YIMRHQHQVSERCVPVKPRIIEPQLLDFTLQKVIEYCRPSLIVRQIKTFGCAAADSHQRQVFGEGCGRFRSSKTQRVFRVRHMFIEFVEDGEIGILDRIRLIRRKDERVSPHSKPEWIVKTKGDFTEDQADQ